MPHDRDQGSFSADIPADAIADALAAVEESEASATTSSTPTTEGGDPAAVDGPTVAPPFEQVRLELEMSQERSRKLYEQLREEHDLRLRAAADLENYRKRAAREREDLQRYGIERLVKDILPVLDSLDRAVAAAGDDPVSAGISMTRRLMEDTLGRFGVKGFSAAGATFDPKLHEALMTVATADHPPGTVLSEQQRGFFLHDRLVRPAAVVVSTAPPAAPAAPGAARIDGSGEEGAGE